jgi:hypothetical protein
MAWAMTLPISPFDGVEEVPGLESVNDADGATVYYKLRGNCPIVIVAPHSGNSTSTPAGAKVFGERRDDPATGRTPTFSDDANTLALALGTVRTLSAMGFVPHAAINLVSRKFMDLNRPWNGQEMWSDAFGTYRPGDETTTTTDFPRRDEFGRFMATYYDSFHDFIRASTSAISPGGWLFDIHGRSVQGADLVPFTAYGHYARRDYVYDNGADSLHSHLLRQGFALDPPTADPGAEVGATTNPTTNLISGNRYGASVFDPSTDPIPRADNVVPSAPHRVHGVQFEFARSLRDGPPEEMEGVGIRLAYAIAGFLLANQVLSRPFNPKAGGGAVEWFSQMG